MSSSSNSASATGIYATGTGERTQTEVLDKLCAKVHRRLGIPVTEPLAVAEHGSATRAMVAARDVLLRNEPGVLSGTAQTSLLCAGVALSRRINCEVEPEDSSALLRTTLTLLFGLLVLGERDEVQKDEYEEVTEEMRLKKRTPRRILREDEQLLAAWRSHTLAQSAFPEHETAATDWSNVLRNESANVSRAALREARYCTDAGAMHTLATLATIFFRCSAAAMVQAAMSRATYTREGDSFLTLDAMAVLDEANGNESEKLAALVTAAESEAGQAVLRDLILSFKLPSAVVGVRRTLMLPREANQAATKSHTSVVNAAHEAAMRGAEWSFASDEDPIHKMCAVLAGIAVILARRPDDIRKGDAFRGRVALPFIETAPPSAGTVMLSLVPATGTWLVYSVDDVGHPRVRASSRGYAGFRETVLLFAKSVRT